jgi:hypothetical protein
LPALLPAPVLLALADWARFPAGFFDNLHFFLGDFLAVPPPWMAFPVLVTLLEVAVPRSAAQSSPAGPKTRADSMTARSGILVLIAIPVCMI